MKDHLQRGSIFTMILKMSSKKLYKIRILVCAIFCNLVFSSCGKLIPASQKDDFFSHLELGKKYFDEGMFDKALEHALVAYDLNPDSELAAKTLGFIYLGLAGADIFSIIVKMQDPSVSKSGQSRAQQLSSFKGIFGITEADYSVMGAFENSVSDLPVIRPYCADQSRNAVSKLVLVNKAIHIICSYVNPSARLADDPRHQCVSNELAQTDASTHLLWALAHLLESISFYAVISYSTTDSSKSNLELRVDRITSLDAKDPTQLQQFVQQVSSLSDLLSQIMPVTSTCSQSDPQTQLVALLNDLLAVQKAFANIPGLPEKIIKPIQDLTAQIKSIEDKLSGAQAKVAQSKSLKSDFSKDIAKKLSDKIKTIDASSLSSEDRTKVCSSLSSIQGSEVGLPDLCAST